MPMAPGVATAQQTVVADGTYRFALAPGPYVLQGHYASRSATGMPFINVIVKAGITEDIDIPNQCM